MMASTRSGPFTVIGWPSPEASRNRTIGVLSDWARKDLSLVSYSSSQGGPASAGASSSRSRSLSPSAPSSLARSS